jgi:hypothetical protein
MKLKKNQNYPKTFDKMIRTKFNIEWWNWEKKSIKNHAKQKTIAIKRIRTKSDIKIKWN